MARAKSSYRLGIMSVDSALVIALLLGIVLSVMLFGLFIKLATGI